VAALAVDPYVTDWLNLVFRWLHVIAAIAWVGASFYFIALDSHLLPPGDRRDEERGVGGEAWEVHGGGFYRVQKYRVAPPTLPDPLHWFKWEAYWTWLSGFALLVVLYYLNADEYLIDPSVSDISAGAAVAISVGLLVVAWVVYDALCRLLPGRDLVLAACLLALVTATAYGLSHVFSGRAVYIQVGAMLGTIMAGNVLFVIIPAHWDLVRAKEAGREPDPAAGLRGKQRSVHNNYLTLPVLFTMIANHFPFTYGRSYGWLILVGLLVVGAWIRLYFNLRHAGRTVVAIPIVAALAIAGIAIAIRPKSAAEPASAAPVAFARVQTIVRERCTACHSSHPTNPSFTSPPLGVTFDTPEQIKARSDAIERLAVESKAMPLGNATGMTDDERALLGRWIRSGAPIK
jgi:uncharacterized membrane protein